MTPSLIPAVAQTFAERLAVCLVGGSLMAVAAGVLLRLRGYGSRARYAVWFAAFVASALLLLPRMNTVSSGTGNASLVLPDQWALYIFGAWAFCVVFALARVAFGAIRIARLRKSCNVVDPEQIPPEVCETLAQFQSRRAVSLCSSAQVTVPAAIGFVRPIVVIPTQLLHELPAADLNQVVLHELAHLQYWDDWTNLGQKLLRAALFFHPAAWWMDRQLTLERELACDDFVVKQTGDSRAYARCLASLAEKSFARRGVTLAQALVSRARQTSERVSRLLKISTPLSGRLVPATAMAGLMFVAGGAIRAYMPTLIAFSNDASPAIAADVDVTTVRPVLAKYLEPVKHGPLKVRKTKVQNSKPLAPQVGMVAKAEAPKSTAGNPQLTHGQTLQPKVILASQRTPATYAVPVGQSFVAVMNEDGDGNTTVRFFQFTVWRVTSQPPDTIEHKT